MNTISFRVSPLIKFNIDILCFSWGDDDDDEEEACGCDDMLDEETDAVRSVFCCGDVESDDWELMS